MSYQQVREILKDVESYHRALHRIVHELYDEDDTDDEPEDGRRQWLVQYVEAQTKAVASALKRYQQDGEQKVLEVWIQYIPDEAVKRRLKEMQSLTDADREQLAELVVDFDRELRDFYSAIADQSSVTDVQVLFNKLRDQSQGLLEQKAWGMRSELGDPFEDDRSKD